MVKVEQRYLRAVLLIERLTRSSRDIDIVSFAPRLQKKGLDGIWQPTNPRGRVEDQLASTQWDLVRRTSQKLSRDESSTPFVC